MGEGAGRLAGMTAARQPLVALPGFDVHGTAAVSVSFRALLVIGCVLLAGCVVAVAAAQPLDAYLRAGQSKTLWITAIPASLLLGFGLVAVNQLLADLGVLSAIALCLYYLVRVLPRLDRRRKR